MADVDYDTMSDEEFLKMSQEDAIEAVSSQTPNEEENQNEENNTPEEEQNEIGNPDGSQSSTDSDESGVSDGGNDPDDASQGTDGEEEEIPEGNQNPMGENGETPTDPKPKKDVTKQEDDGKQPNADPKKDGEKASDGQEYKLPEGVKPEQVDTAIEFHKKLTTPFKADGKDFTVRSAEDAIRLMQQGVNYSRRMEEIKPMKALNRMLTDHDLNDASKLSFLIDVSKGDKQAITKLLKDNNLDPMDLDISEESGYQEKSYAGNPQDNEFREALENTIATPEGQALVSEIHKSWDEKSKARLREDPSILGNLLNLKQHRIYDQVANEVAYQRSIGYLTNVPFLQAFDQVGEVMKSQGVFNKNNNAQPAPSSDMGQLSNNTQQNQPVASGARKAQPAKKAAPNPHLSSTPPSKQSNQPTNGQPDFDKMSDEEFLKMAPPS